MKKNNMLRIASVLLVAVLLSTCAISGAFAKYTTKGTATDSARVAAFGIDVEATGGAFSQWYKNTKLDSNTAEATVAGAAKVVAPGTNGSLGAVTIEGTAEVDVEVEVEATLGLTGWVLDAAVYCPIVITVAGTPYDLSTITTPDALTTKIAEIEGAIEALTETFEANDDIDLSAAYTWEWAFEADTDGMEPEAAAAAIAAKDAKDTALARLAADLDDTNDPTISLTVTATVTQID